MIRSIETTGKTKELAIRAALEQLSLTEDDITYEILELGRTGFLGIGAVPARVRVSYDDGQPEPKPEKQQPKPQAKKAEEPKKPEGEKKPEAKKAEPARKAEPKAIADGTLEKEVESFLTGLLEHMGVECTMEISPRESGGLEVKLDGPDMGAVIGRRGETLDAIQHLVNYAVNRGSDKRMHISVDAEGYRSKREESLVHLAQKMAAKAIKYKRSMALEPMNSYERHVIHTALQDYEGVSTSSTGVEPNRRVVVNYERPEGEAEEPRRSGRSDSRSRRSNRGEGRSNRPQRTGSAPAPAAETAAPVEEKKAETQETLPPDYPADYTPPTKNKPQSREWC
jgi:spoIIIJ-associated protein